MSLLNDTLSLRERYSNVNTRGYRRQVPARNSTYYCGEAVKKRTDFHTKRRLQKYERKELRVAEVRYVPTPDAELRLSHAIDILLGAATEKKDES
jgi:hypothetical protein